MEISQLGLWLSGALRVLPDDKTEKVFRCVKKYLKYSDKKFHNLLGEVVRSEAEFDRQRNILKRKKLK